MIVPERLVIKHNLFWVKSLVWQKALLQWLTHFYGHSNFEPSYEVTGPAAVAWSLCNSNLVLLVLMLSKTQVSVLFLLIVLDHNGSIW